MASPDRSAEARDLARELAGAGRFRRLMRYLALAWLMTTLIASTASFVTYLHKLEMTASGRNPYAAIQQWASLSYYLVWLAVSLDRKSTRLNSSHRR